MLFCSETFSYVVYIIWVTEAYKWTGDTKLNFPDVLPCSSILSWVSIDLGVSSSACESQHPAKQAFGTSKWNRIIHIPVISYIL